MKLTLDRAALLKALDPAARVVEKRNTIPILGNILLTAKDGMLRLTATDLDMEMRCAFPAEVEREGGITVPAQRFHDIARKLPESATITLELAADQNSLTLRAGRSRFQLNTLPASDFPDISPGEMPISFTLPAPALAEIIAKTRFAISSEETRYYLCGIFLHPIMVDGVQLLHAVATDGHRLARYRLQAPEGSAAMPAIIIPTKTVGEVARLIDKSKEDVAITLSPTKIRFTVGDFVLTSKLIDGTYPDYQRVIPAGNERIVTLDSPALAAAADRVATISSERGRAVKLSFSDAGLQLAVTNPDSGFAHEEVDCDWQGEAMDIGFNARYLADSLAVIGGDTVEMRLADPGSPTILQAREGSDLLTVLMPMRV
jgi:DNA polymerase-3 subunit beta